MLFQHLSRLAAKGVAITIKVADAGSGKLEVNIFPDAGKSGAPLLAKSFVATPAELDAEFGGVVLEYCTINGTLKEQLADLQQQAAAAVAQAKAKSPGTKSKPAPTKADDDNDDDEHSPRTTPDGDGDSQAAPFSL